MQHTNDMEGEVFKIPTNASSKPRPQTQKLSYAPPEWSGSCQEPYSVEIIKSGSIVDELNLINEEYVVFGREPPSRIVMQHPSISRHHAVLQYCPKVLNLSRTLNILSLSFSINN